MYSIDMQEAKKPGRISKPMRASATMPWILAQCLGEVAWQDLSGRKGSEEAALKSWRMFTVILCFWGQRTSTPRMEEVKRQLPLQYSA